MKEKFSKLIPIILLSFIPTFLLWIPFIFNLDSFWTIPLPENTMAALVANYDGPLYIVVAKTLYNLDAIAANYSFDLPLEYYAAHYPLYPLLIRLVASLTGFLTPLSEFAGYPYATLIVTALSSIVALYYFNAFIKQYVKPENALWMTTLFAFFPARWLTVRSVGSPEPLFIAAVIASIYYFQNKKYWYAGLLGIVAQLTKSPGILLFVAYGATLAAQSFKQFALARGKKLEQYINWRAYPIFLIPFSLLGLFVVYGYTFGDFFAYFNSGDNIHLFFPPFQVFNYSEPWVGTFWLEEIIFIYLIGSLGLLRLVRLYKQAKPKDKEKNAVVMWFVTIFFVTILFVSHRDVMRYSLPIVPFLFAAWSKELVSKDMKLAFLIIVVPIFLYSLAFISQNVMPIGSWAPFL